MFTSPGLLVTKIFSLLFFIFVSIDVSFAYLPRFAFWKNRVNSLKFTTSGQIVMTNNCSNVVTVKSYSPEGALRTVSSPLTINLVGPASTTFYSDSTCTDVITSVTIAAGSNTASYYYVDSSTGVKGLSASATNYTSATQTTTVNTNLFVWTGGGGDALWSTGGNWSGGAAPNSTQRALFNGTCAANCSPTISSNINVMAIRMAADYSGTITQSGTATVTTQGGGWAQLNGTFIGGTGNISLTGFALKAGSFTSTSGSLEFRDSTLPNSATFNHNNGTVVLGGYTLNINAPLSFYNFDFHGMGSPTVNGTLNVQNLRYLDFGYLRDVTGTHTINVAGNLETQGSRWATGSNSLIRMTGTGTITGSPGSYVYHFEIATSGTITFAPTGRFDIRGNFNYTSGTVVTAGSHVDFMGNDPIINPGTLPFHHVSFITEDNGSVNVTVNGTMTVLGDLTLDCTSYGASLNTGTLNVSGNVNLIGSQFKGGTALVRMVGTGTITGGGLGTGIPNLEIATSGTVTFAQTGAADIWNSFTYTSGNVVTTNSTVIIRGSGNPVTINTGSMRFNNLTIRVSGGNTSTAVGTIFVDGNLSFENASFTPRINGGTFEVKKDLTSSNWYGGTSEVILNGTGAQTVTGSGYPGSGITVNSTSSVLTLTSNVTVPTSQAVNVIAGSVNMAGFSLTTKVLTLNSNVLTKNGGVLTVNGSVAGTGALYGGTVNP